MHTEYKAPNVSGFQTEGWPARADRMATRHVLTLPQQAGRLGEILFQLLTRSRAGDLNSRRAQLTRRDVRQRPLELAVPDRDARHGAPKASLSLAAVGRLSHRRSGSCLRG